MKKIIILSVLLALSLFSFNCGGGSGSSNSPKGENPGEPSVVQLLPSHFIAQTNSMIILHAKVLDGNGAPVNNIPVSFTNLSPVGVLSGLTAKTNSIGIASVTLKSTTTGFSTVQAEVNKGFSQVRDRRTVFFTDQNVLRVRLLLDVDADNDLNYDEQSDITLGETPDDNSVKIRARVYDVGGWGPLAGRQVWFDSERAYRVGTSILGTNTTWPCSDGSDTCWIAFPLDTTVYTNEQGEAFVQVIVAAESLRNFTSNLNIFATADNGSANMKTLFISPVSVGSVTVTANPNSIGLGETSEITATAMTNTNQPVPDGTTINFAIDTACATAGGTIDPFGRTTDGSATAIFTAPSTPGTCTITGRVGEQSDTVDVIVS